MKEIRTSTACLGLFLFALVSVVSSDQSCEEQVTADMKFKVVRDSLKNVKTLFPKCRDPGDDKNKCGKKDSASAYLNLALDTLDGLKVTGGGKEVKCPKCPDPGTSGPVDCSDILEMGYTKSGVYTVYPRNRINGTIAIDVYCDMDTDNGGWTVFHRRHNYTEQINFYRGWDAYKVGFGDLEKEFWLGNDYIYTLSNQGVYSLRVDLINYAGTYGYALYESFWITDEEDSYELHVQDYTGNATNGMDSQHKMKFSTFDRPYNNNPCPERHQGAWWYPGGCAHGNLNGKYQPGVNHWHSNWWLSWNAHTGVHFSEMKIRHHSLKTK